MTQIITAKGKVEIRELHSVDDMVAAEKIQLIVWGKDTIPHCKEMLIPVQHEGGLVAGAFSEEGEMIGVVFGFPCAEQGAMHSQLVATLKEWRSQGIGAQLKWYQRSWCLEHGYSKMRWTVDPLRAANAELNIRKLGGTSRTYYENYYGVMQGIDAGAPSDRLLLEWGMTSQRVALREQNTPADLGFPQAGLANEVVEGEPVHSKLDLQEEQVLIRIPDDFISLAARDAQLANRWRMHTRQLFEHYFARGYILNEFTRLGGPAYLLEKKAV